MAIRKLQNTPDMIEAAEIFTNPNRNSNRVVRAGNTIMFHLFNGTAAKAQNLNHLRFIRFMEKTATSNKCFSSSSLPPTQLRPNITHCVHTIKYKWMDQSSDMDPLNFDWQILDNIMHMKYTDLEPAPRELIKTI